jgi:hypothetical protein
VSESEPGGPTDLPLPDLGPPAPRPGAEAARPASAGVFSMKNPSPPEQVRAVPGIRAVADDRLAEIERMVGRNQWAEICKLLAPEPAAVEQLPASLALVYAVALKESRPAGTDADRRAIGAIADILGVHRESALALVLGKRLTRRRNWAETPAPSRGFSVAVLALGLALGSVVGWILTEVFL